MYKVKIHYHNDIDEVLLPGEEPLLSELEQCNMLANFNCRQGHCGLCIAELLAGEVEHFKVLYPLNSNEILLCSSKPVGDIAIRIH